MPRWARFLSCSLTGALLLLTGLPVTAWLWEGGPHFWRQFLEFAATPDMLLLMGAAGAASALTLVLGRALVNLYGWSAAAGGLAAGMAVPAACASFLIAAHASAWGGWIQALRRALPDALLFAVPFLATGLVAAWLWDRLD